MLIEAVVTALSLPSTPAGFRRHLPEAVGLWARGRRQLRAWAPHLSKTIGVIDTTLDEIPQRRTVAVLGSGPLLDVPLESLARNFTRVLLIDRAHLAVNRSRIKPYGNIEVVWRDLAAAGAATPLDFLDAIPDLDWVISVNLVSQLGHGAPPGRERQAIDAHLDGLARLKCRSTLITDYDYRIFDRQGALLEQFDLLYGRIMPEPESRWLWEVAPWGEERPDARRIHSVLAYPEWPRS